MSVILEDDINLLNKLKEREKIQQEMADEIVKLCVDTISTSKKFYGIITRETLSKYNYFGNTSPLTLSSAYYKISKNNVLISLDYSDYEGNLSNFPISYCEERINRLLKPYGISTYYSAKQSLSKSSCFIVKRTLYIMYDRVKRYDKRTKKTYVKNKLNDNLL